LELLYQGDSEVCKEKYKDYLLTRVIRPPGHGDGTPTSSDNTLRKYYKGLLQKFSEDSPSLFASSNLTTIP
jgi:hypothetical protein